MNNNDVVTLDGEILNTHYAPKNIMESLTEMLTELQENHDVFVCDRLNDPLSFEDIYANSKFEYNTRVLLLERFFKGAFVDFEKREIRGFRDDVEETLKELYSVVNSRVETIVNSKEPSDSEKNNAAIEALDKIQEIMDDSSKENSEYIVDKVIDVALIKNTFGFKESYLVEDLKDIPKDELERRAVLLEAYILSYVGNMYMRPLSEFTPVIKIINNTKYIDLIIEFI